MFRFDPRRVDWRGWSALVWMLVASAFYARMVVVERGGKAAGIVKAIAGRVEGASTPSPSRTVR
ncbi:MAG: hypothetical protein KGM43_17380 [Planctomycetota bacterium]|nr:hypothetical protein [Planctomycetota bacterium]